METLTIAAWTVLALISLVFEYHTRLFSRSLGLTRRRTRHAGPDEPAVEITLGPLGRSVEPEAVAVEFRANAIALPRSVPRIPVQAVVTEEAEARILAEVKAVVAQLVAVEGDLARGGRPQGLFSLAKLAMNYDLDDLMDLPDRDLSREVISYYRGVARTAAGVAEFFRDASGTQPFGDVDPEMEEGRHVLHAAVAGEVARGAQLVHRLRE